jgi:proteic killer suppression protein
MGMIKKVEISRAAKKDLRSVPAYIVDKFTMWVTSVEEDGLGVRKKPGYHDEPLLGERRGQRSIRLTVAYRAIYVILSDGSVEFVSVEEVNKHGY